MLNTELEQHLPVDELQQKIEDLVYDRVGCPIIEYQVGPTRLTQKQESDYVEITQRTEQKHSVYGVILAVGEPTADGCGQYVVVGQDGSAVLLAAKGKEYNEYFADYFAPEGEGIHILPNYLSNRDRLITSLVLERSSISSYARILIDVTKNPEGIVPYIQKAIALAKEQKRLRLENIAKGKPQILAALDDYNHP